jgi:hypothetical protein
MHKQRAKEDRVTGSYRTQVLAAAFCCLSCFTGEESPEQMRTRGNPKTTIRFIGCVKVKADAKHALKDADRWLDVSYAFLR